MILADVEIEDFKQFHGVHHFTPPATGIVGILGDNGAGKTTLFQAIEWCLYQPRELELSDIPTRGQVAKPRVKVTLHDPAEDVRFVVERRLEAKRGGYQATAEIFREDQPDTRIVHGSRQVSDYVERRLLGLSHRAFVTTFFTRQKELSFFGDLKDTDRRREVGKLLGFDTIRAAQKRIADDRTTSRAEAQQLAMIYTRRLGNRDLAAEAQEADLGVALRAQEVDAAEEQLRVAAVALGQAKTSIAALRTLKDQDAALRQDLARVDGEIKAATSRRDGAQQALAQLDDAERQRAALAPIATEEGHWADTVRVCESERERHRRSQDIQAILADVAGRRRQLARDMERSVTSVTAVIDGWCWLPADAADPLAAADRLIALAQTRDADVARKHAAALQSCLDLAARCSEHEAKIAQYTERLALREQQRAALLAEGDPDAELHAVRRRREAAAADAQSALARGGRAREEIENLTPLVESLRSLRFDQNCPTCGRPFSQHDATAMLKRFESRLALEHRTLADEMARHNQALASVEHCDAEADTLGTRKEQLDDLANKLQVGREHVEHQTAELEIARNVFECHLAEHGIDLIPTPHDVESARRDADTIERVGRSGAALGQIRRQLLTERDREETSSAELTALGPILYDAETHRDAQERLRAAQDAAAQIRTFDADLTRRPIHLAAFSAAQAELCQLTTARDDLDTRLQALNFDPATLTQAEIDEQAALDTEREALQQQAEAVGAHRQAIEAKKRLMEDHDAIADLGKRAGERGREADDLDRMYREFSWFEQFVARRLTPQLAEHTADLLSQVTAGKYQRVELTDNFGIKVFDGDDESYSIEAFSGGERDVIALCARLALSHLIGSQAHRPPSFLVLDEVFGSLDAQRRTQLLDTLSSLTGADDAFSQLFVISHVDDVRVSSIFDDLWKVTETAAGVSTLENSMEISGVEDT